MDIEREWTIRDRINQIMYYWDRNGENISAQKPYWKNIELNYFVAIGYLTSRSRLLINIPRVILVIESQIIGSEAHNHYEHKTIFGHFIEIFIIIADEVNIYGQRWCYWVRLFLFIFLKNKNNFSFSHKQLSNTNQLTNCFKSVQIQMVTVVHRQSAKWSKRELRERERKRVNE